MRQFPERIAKTVAIGLGACLLLSLSVACGSLRAHSSAASSSGTISPTPGATFTPFASPSPSYKAYSSPEWKYTLEYPALWYSFPAQPISDSATTKTFSNQDTESPEGLQEDGLFVAITVDPSNQICDTSQSASDAEVTSAALTIDGVPTREWSYKNGIGVRVLHAKWCYDILVLTIDTKGRDKYRAEAEHLFSSFRFNR
jgi:hypothetical protein